MASHSTPRVPNSDANIRLIGKHIADCITGRSPQFSGSEEAFYWGVAFRSYAQLKRDYLDLLNTGDDFFHSVRANIEKLSRLWDAVMRSKQLYDASGLFLTDKQFMKSFVLCAHLVADRSNLGDTNESEIQRYNGNLQNSTMLRRTTPGTMAPLRTFPFSLLNPVIPPAVPGSLPGYDLPLPGNPEEADPEAFALSTQPPDDEGSAGDEATDDCLSCGQSSDDNSDWDEEDTQSTVQVRCSPPLGPFCATRVLPTPLPTHPGGQQAPVRIAPSADNKRNYNTMAADGN